MVGVHPTPAAPMAQHLGCGTPPPRRGTAPTPDPQTVGSHTECGYLQLPLLLLHDGPDDGERAVGEAQHEQEGELVLDGDQEGIRNKRRVREPLRDHRELLKQLARGGVGVVLHDGPVHRVLHGQEAFTDVP